MEHEEQDDDVMVVVVMWVIGLYCEGVVHQKFVPAPSITAGRFYNGCGSESTESVRNGGGKNCLAQHDSLLAKTAFVSVIAFGR